MKKWLFAAAAVLVLGYGNLLPFETMDAGELCIVETLFVEQNGDAVTLYADDMKGAGEDFISAVENMENEAPGRLFLRQVKRIVFCRGAERRVEALALSEEISMGTAVYISDEPAQTLMEDLENLEKRLEAKEQREEQIPTLAQIQNGVLKEASRELE